LALLESSEADNFVARARRVLAPLGHRIGVDPGEKARFLVRQPDGDSFRDFGHHFRVRLVERPSPTLPRLLLLSAGSLFMSHFSFFVRLGNSFRFRSLVREGRFLVLHIAFTRFLLAARLF
jgi:hypothetical protein